MKHGEASRFEFPQPDGTSVLGHRFINPDGNVGGWVADDAVVEEGAYIEVGAVVFPKSHIRAGEHVKPEAIMSVHDLSNE